MPHEQMLAAPAEMLAETIRFQLALLKSHRNHDVLKVLFVAMSDALSKLNQIDTNTYANELQTLNKQLPSTYITSLPEAFTALKNKLTPHTPNTLPYVQQMHTQIQAIIAEHDAAIQRYATILMQNGIQPTTLLLRQNYIAWQRSLKNHGQSMVLPHYQIVLFRPINNLPSKTSFSSDDKNDTPPANTNLIDDATYDTSPSP